jgi:hypothetical protein
MASGLAGSASVHCRRLSDSPGTARIFKLPILQHFHAVADNVLTNHRPRCFLVNEEALGYVEAFGLSAVRRRQLGQLPAGTSVDETTMQAQLDAHLPGLGPQQRKWILDATAVAA